MHTPDQPGRPLNNCESVPGTVSRFLMVCGRGIAASHERTTARISRPEGLPHDLSEMTPTDRRVDNRDGRVTTRLQPAGVRAFAH